MKNGLLSLVLSAGLVLSGCATIVHGTTQPIPFSSNPEGAEVFVNGTARGVTPTTVELARSASSYNVVYKKPGYEDTAETLHSSISGYYFLNIVLGGIVGLVLDAADGAWYAYDDPSPVNMPITVAYRTDQATISAASTTSVEPKSQVASEPASLVGNNTAAEAAPVRHVRPDPDARASWIQQ